MKSIHHSVFTQVTSGDSGGLNPCTFPERIKVPLFSLQDLRIIIIKLESNVIRKIHVIFLPFLNLKTIVPSYSLFTRFLVCTFCRLDTCWTDWTLKIPDRLKIPCWPSGFLIALIDWLTSWFPRTFRRFNVSRPRQSITTAWYFDLIKIQAKPDSYLHFFHFIFIFYTWRPMILETPQTITRPDLQGAM